MKKIKLNFLFLIYILILFIVNTLIYNNFFSDYILNLANFSDLQWSPSVLFVQKIDVYKSFYDNNLKNIIFSSGFPNYSTVSIYLHLFISKLSFEDATLVWFFLFNIIMIYLYLILKNNTNLKELKIFFILIIFLMSKPYILLLSKGQFSIISLLSFFLYFLFKNKKSFLGFYLISVKYSFFPLALFYDVILKKRFKYFVYTVLLTFIFVSHYSYIFNSNFFDNLIAPLLIGKYSAASGVLDIQTLLGNHPKNDFIRYIILLILGLVIFFIIQKNTLRNEIFDMSICSLLTLLIFKHLYYDFVLLLPVLLYVSKINKKILKYFGLLIICYFWFFYLNSFTISFLYSKIFMFSNFIFLNLLLIIVVISNLKENKNFILNKK